MKTYIASNGDTWDSIAYKVYGDEFMCDELCAANSRNLEGVVMFEGGEHVAVPEVITTQIDVIKAPWE
jgi:phage tail protein X